MTYPDWMIPELDFAILALLPAEGSMAGYVPVGSTARGVWDRLGSKHLSVPNVGGRLGLMAKHNYVRTVHTLVPKKGNGGRLIAGSNVKAYQVTSKGLDALRRWTPPASKNIDPTQGHRLAGPLRRETDSGNLNQ